MIDLLPSGSPEISYLVNYRVSGLFLIVPPRVERPCVLIGHAVDVRKSAAALAYKYARLFPAAKRIDAVDWVSWCDRANAVRVYHGLTRRYGGAVLPLSLADAIGQISDMVQRLGARLSPHETVMQKVGAATQKIANRVEASRVNGNMVAFNAEYRRRRMLAQPAGRHFPTYGLAVSRLRKALAGHAPGASGVPTSLLEQVFGKGDD